MKTKLLTKKDVAAALSMSTRSVDRLVASEALKPIRLLRSVARGACEPGLNRAPFRHVDRDSFKAQAFAGSATPCDC